jgi:hypothetical protein
MDGHVGIRYTLPWWQCRLLRRLLPQRPALHENRLYVLQREHDDVLGGEGFFNLVLCTVLRALGRHTLASPSNDAVPC